MGIKEWINGWVDRRAMKKRERAEQRKAELKLHNKETEAFNKEYVRLIEDERIKAATKMAKQRAHEDAKDIAHRRFGRPEPQPRAVKPITTTPSVRREHGNIGKKAIGFFDSMDQAMKPLQGFNKPLLGNNTSRRAKNK